ncbi:MAG: hypothetical protein ACYTBP_10835 [Planctomycetota bacterium]|jgi:hypothetical protein
MKSIERRVERIEDKLNIGDKRTGVFVVLTSNRTKELPEPVEEWITYKEAKERCGEVGLFIADPEAELEAREKQQKATESNKKAKK